MRATADTSPGRDLDSETGADSAPADRPRPPRRATRSRSGNPAARPVPSAVKPGKSAVGTAPEPVTAGSKHTSGRFLLAAVLITLLVATYTVGVMFLPWAVDSFVLVTLLAVPALITMIFVPEARTRGLYRWPVAWALGFTSIYPVPVLVAAQAWVLVRFWLVEGTPRWPGRLPSRRGRDPRT